MSGYVRLPIGTVIRCHVINTRPPKTKRFVIVGYYNKDVVTVYFNSEINNIHNYNAELQALHIPCENKPYLSKKCFCDCSEVFLQNDQNLHEAHAVNPNIAIGNLSKKDLDDVINMLKTSPKIKGVYKNRYGFYDYK